MLLCDEERKGGSQSQAYFAVILYTYYVLFIYIYIYIYIYHNDGLSLENKLKQIAECGGLTFSQFHGIFMRELSH
jgi:hypothetical protein